MIMIAIPSIPSILNFLVRSLLIFPFLFLRLPLNFRQHRPKFIEFLLIALSKEFVMEMTFVVRFADLVEIVHV